MITKKEVRDLLDEIEGKGELAEAVLGYGLRMPPHGELRRLAQELTDTFELLQKELDRVTIEVGLDPNDVYG